MHCLFRRSLAECDFFQGFSDCHSHLLPDVDDGVQTMDEALALLALYERLGIRSVRLTPHVMEDIPNATAALKRRFEQLKAAYAGPVRLSLAAEYMMDRLFEERLAAGDLLALDPEGQLLVETSYFNPPMNLHDLLAETKRKGWHPVLAHPERYAYQDAAGYERLKASGVRFQLNLFSLTGAYGKHARDKARMLLKKGYYDCIGTDVHSLAFFERQIALPRFSRKMLQTLIEIK